MRRGLVCHQEGPGRAPGESSHATEVEGGLPTEGFQQEPHRGVDEDGPEGASHRGQGGKLVLLVLRRPPELEVIILASCLED